MEFDDLPGVSIDIPSLLQALGKATAVRVVRSLVGKADVELLPACIKARGVSVDVVELLKSLEHDDLLSVVQKGFDSWRDIKLEILHDLHNFVVGSRPSSTSTDGSVRASDSVVSTAVMSPRDKGKLPQINVAGDRHVVSDTSLLHVGRKPPRQSKTNLGGSRSTPCLPQLGKNSDPFEACADRGARQLGDRLLQAVQNKDAASVQSLLAARANIEQQNKDGFNSTTLAMFQGTPYNILRALLEGRADINAIDGQNRSLTHLWAWSLPKTKNGVREAQKKLQLLVKFRADLNAKLPVTGDTPLHILARVYNTLSVRAEEKGRGNSRHESDEILGDSEKYKRCTQSRILLLTGSGASTFVRNGEGKKPFSLIDTRFRFILQPIMEEDACSDASFSFSGKSRCIELQEETSMSLD